MSLHAMDSNALNTTQMYLKQAQRLAEILLEYSEDAEKFLAEIAPLQQKTDRLMRRNTLAAPVVPRRGSDGEFQPLKPPRISRHLSIEDPYVNLKEAMRKNVIKEVDISESKEEDDDAKSTLKAKIRKPRAPMRHIPERIYESAVQVHKEAKPGTSKSIVKNEIGEKFIQPEEMLQNTFKRSGLSPSRVKLGNARIRA